MARVIASACLITLLASVAAGDKLVLLDGRTFTGTVTVEGQSVRIDMPYGTLRFAREEVLLIDFKDTPETKLAKKLAKTHLDDPDALFKLAEWATANSLDRQADTLYELILKLETDHQGARRRMGFVRIDGTWLEFDVALELARSKLAAGQYRPLLKDVLPALDAAAGTAERRRKVRELIGISQLRSKDFAAAEKTFTELSAIDSDDAPRYATIAEILKSSKDGMYVLTEPYPPQGRLVASSGERLEAGPVSLAKPQVLQAALREKAKKEIDAGRKLLSEALKSEATDPEAAKGRYFQASQAFDRAESLVANIARSWRIEICRRRIAVARKDIDLGAQKFVREQETLGHRNLSAADYRGKLLRLMHRLNSVRGDLQNILTIAKPYPRELVLEVGWAQADLKQIAKMRQTLMEELNGDN